MRITKDAGQRIFDFVGNPRSKLAEGSHFFGLYQLFLGLVKCCFPRIKLIRHLVE